MKVVFLASDISEASQIKTARSIIATGARLTTFSFRRRNMNLEFRPDWEDIHLGYQQNERLAVRALQTVKAIGKLLKNSKVFMSADVIVARNLDMACLGLFAKLLSLGKTRLIYQCLDIHSVMCRSDLVGLVARWIERCVLNWSDRLIISSSGFQRNYFDPIQKYSGKVQLLENKIHWTSAPPKRVDRNRRKPGPMRVGWVGTLRCPKSFEILLGTAERLGSQVEFRFAGVVHRHALPDFDHHVARLTNVSYTGPYTYPDGLSAVYNELDLVWAQDLWQRKTNSDWLLPNRLYEAGYFGCPSIAVSGTETARKIDFHGLGFVIEEADAEALSTMLSNVSIEEIMGVRGKILLLPENQFVLSSEETAQMLNFNTDEVPLAQTCP